MCAATARVFSMSVEVSNTKGAGERKKKKKNSCCKRKVAELCDQQSGLFSKCWRAFTEFSKLPFVREVGVHRKKILEYIMEYEDTHKSVKTEGCSGLKRACN